MRLMDVLPDYEIKRLSRAPILSDEDRRHYFKLDPPIEELIKPAREPHNKIGIWLNYIYFKVSGRFYNQEHFRPCDIRMAAKILGVAHPKEVRAHNSDRTRQKKRLCVLKHC